MSDPIQIDLLLQNNLVLPESTGNVDSTQVSQMDMEVLPQKHFLDVPEGEFLTVQSLVDDFPINDEFEMKFQCDVCQKWYKSKAVLRKHVKIHQRAFSCTKCDKNFTSVYLLEKHEKLHLGYRPFSCRLCTNSFSEESNLKTHIRR